MLHQFFLHTTAWALDVITSVTLKCLLKKGLDNYFPIGVGTGEAEGALAPPILGIMCIKYAEFILDTPFGAPLSCLRSYARPVARLLSGEVLISHYRDHALFRDYTNAARVSGGTL